MHAKRLDSWAEQPFTKKFLAATSSLPKIAPRTVYHDEKKTRFYKQSEYDALPANEKSALTAKVLDEEYYYNTKYGSPLSYSRVLDVLLAHGVKFEPGRRFLDFGYGYIGHLRLLATLGLDASGIEVDPLLPVLYGEPGDQGEMAGIGVKGGKVRLFDGFFPKDTKLVAAVGSGYDIIVSKNVLKKGYIHPDRTPDPKYKLIDMGVPDEVVMKSFFDALKPGGYFMIFNICPALSPPDKPFIPWSDGRSPYSKAQYEAAGFKVIELDKDDYKAVNKMAHLLDWDKDPDDKWDVDKDLSVLYTLVQRP